MTALSSLRSTTNLTVLSFLEAKKVGSPRSVSLAGDNTQIANKWSNSFLKVSRCILGIGQCILHWECSLIKLNVCWLSKILIMGTIKQFGVFTH